MNTADLQHAPCIVDHWSFTGEPVIGGFIIVADSFVNHPEMGSSEDGIRTTRVTAVGIDGAPRIVRTKNVTYALGEPSPFWHGRSRDQFESAFPQLFPEVQS